MTGARKHSSVSIAVAKYGYLRKPVKTNRRRGSLIATHPIAAAFIAEAVRAPLAIFGGWGSFQTLLAENGESTKGGHCEKRKRGTNKTIAVSPVWVSHYD